MTTLQTRISKLERQEPQEAEVTVLSDAERARRILALLRWAQAHPEDEQAQRDAARIRELLGLSEEEGSA